MLLDDALPAFAFVMHVLCSGISVRDFISQLENCAKMSEKPEENGPGDDLTPVPTDFFAYVGTAATKVVHEMSYK